MPQASHPMSILLQNLKPILVLAVLHSISKEQVTHNTTVPPQWPQFQCHLLVALPLGLQMGHGITIVPAAITPMLNWSNMGTKKNRKEKPKPWKIKFWKIRNENMIRNKFLLWAGKPGKQIMRHNNNLCLKSAPCHQSGRGLTKSKPHPLWNKNLVLRGSE